ncbi:MAG: prefoldin subunit alpha [Candidatus Heimdallarchaeota archaeon]|nr:prefoldin subunit alpha [Candidatus Heimdallarchaeota archaeon]MCK5048235.1 prefoldin subunit alpha [Candidatus Heimdallarchaeota archaeon]
MSTPSNQMSLDEILRQIQYYEQQAENLEQQVRSLDQIVMQYTLVKQTFQEISPVSAGNEILIPIGPTAFMKGTISDTEKVLVGVGADVLIEQPISVALEMMTEKIAEFNEIRTNIVTQYTKTAEALTMLKRSFELQQQQQSQQQDPMNLNRLAD